MKFIILLFSVTFLSVAFSKVTTENHHHNNNNLQSEKPPEEIIQDSKLLNHSERFYCFLLKSFVYGLEKALRDYTNSNANLNLTQLLQDVNISSYLSEFCNVGNETFGGSKPSKRSIKKNQQESIQKLPNDNLSQEHEHAHDFNTTKQSQHLLNKPTQNNLNSKQMNTENQDKMDKLITTFEEVANALKLMQNNLVHNDKANSHKHSHPSTLSKEQNEIDEPIHELSSSSESKSKTKAKHYHIHGKHSHGEIKSKNKSKFEEESSNGSRHVAERVVKQEQLTSQPQPSKEVKSPCKNNSKLLNNAPTQKLDHDTNNVNHENTITKENNNKNMITTEKINENHQLKFKHKGSKAKRSIDKKQMKKFEGKSKNRQFKSKAGNYKAKHFQKKEKYNKSKRVGKY